MSTNTNTKNANQIDLVYNYCCGCLLEGQGYAGYSKNILDRGWVVGVWPIQFVLGFLNYFYLDKTPKQR